MVEGESLGTDEGNWYLYSAHTWSRAPSLLLRNELRARDFLFSVSTLFEFYSKSINSIVHLAFVSRGSPCKFLSTNVEHEFAWRFAFLSNTLRAFKWFIARNMKRSPYLEPSSVLSLEHRLYYLASPLQPPTTHVSTIFGWLSKWFQHWFTVCFVAFVLPALERSTFTCFERKRWIIILVVFWRFPSSTGQVSFQGYEGILHAPVVENMLEKFSSSTALTVGTCPVS